MQTWITDYDIAKSAANLDTKRLGAQIYEGIHILASLLGVNDRLVNPKRDVSNHPAAQLWKGYESSLFIYLQVHMDEWFARDYDSDINALNMEYFEEYTNITLLADLDLCWITDDLIQTHRSVLIQKKPEHYRPLWPECPDNLTMRYDWRKM